MTAQGKPLGKCYAEDIGGSWNCVYHAINVRDEPCVAPEDYECEYKTPKITEKSTEKPLSQRPVYDESDPSLYIGGEGGNWVLVGKKYYSHEELESLEAQVAQKDEDGERLFDEKTKLEAERDKLKIKAEKWDILENTHKGRLTEAFVTQRTRAESAESEVKRLRECLKIRLNTIAEIHDDRALISRRLTKARGLMENMPGVWSRHGISDEFIAWIKNIKKALGGSDSYTKAEAEEKSCSNCDHWTRDKTNLVFGACPFDEHHSSTWSWCCDKHKPKKVVAEGETPK